jgi:hypothetical protein
VTHLRVRQRMKPIREVAQPDSHALPMSAEFAPEDAASLIKMQLGNLDPARPDRSLVEKVRWYAVSVSQSRYGGTPKMRKLLGNLEDHLTTLEYPALALDSDSEPSDARLAHAGALSIANGILGLLAR